MTPRNGLTRVEVAILISTLVAMAALGIPSLQKSREKARQIKCQNNLRYITLATQSAARLKMEFPSLINQVDGVDYGWPIRLLAYIDHADLYLEPELSIPTFTCPSDLDTHGQPGGLSYVANAGYGDFVWNPKTMEITDTQAAAGREHDGTNINWDRSESKEITAADREIARDTGVFWRMTDDHFRMPMYRISERDGLSNTLLFTESLHAGNDRKSGWISAVTNEIAFVFPAGVEDQLPRYFGTRGGPLAIDKEHFSADELQAFSILTGAKAKQHPRGKRPAPSSSHYGLVNVMYCDGRSGTLSEGIDLMIYIRMMSSGGEPLGQSLLDPGDVK